ncbi:hypothetical protein B0A81_15475 [Flavobacterium plurextorum]|uniref:Lipoprotein n=1 Tax=Flavobacterium plurextorum TaxID=1114867 RepID=A0ABX4CRY3_9FLAO|nr:hypothetical protein [Flavobacterium plurextorum]OXB05105.1 hypothetical protein B0A81_15475 [Flavobacterium plurextorum]
MNKLKIIIALFVLLSISCSKKSEIELIFIASINEYWSYKDDCLGTKGIYFQFKENGTHDKYLLHIDDGFSLFNTDMGGGNDVRTWSIKNDTTFVFDNEEYKIEKISDEEILLSYYHYKIKNKKCFVRLRKWVDGPEGPKPLDSVKAKQ